MHRCFIALGGNIGDVRSHFEAALRKMAAHPRVASVSCSGLYRTSAVGEDPSERYLNAVAECKTSLDPLELRAFCHDIEREAGRERERHWAPRPLDLDLIFYGQEQISWPELTVPHVACWYRRFVLDPLVELAPDVIHPGKQVTVEVLRQRLLEPINMVILGDPADARWREVPSQLVKEFPTAKVSLLSPWTSLPESPPTFLVWPGAGNFPDADAENYEKLAVLPRLDAREHRGHMQEFLRAVMQAALPEEMTRVEEPIVA